MPSPNSFHHLAVLIIILHIAAGACSQDHPPFLTFCSGDNYTESSPYKSNLNSLISDLVSSTPNSPTYFSLINSTTTSPNIYGLAQCRPDVSSVGCAACLNNMASIAPKPDGGCELKTSGFFRDHNCLLIYSDQMFYTALQEQIFVFLAGLGNASSVSFSRHMQAQIDTVILSASESALRFAVGLAEAPADAVDIFTMGWCSMDLTTDDCFQCLNNVLKVMPAGKNRGTCVTVSCVARFETYQFYSTSMIPAESGLSRCLYSLHWRMPPPSSALVTVPPMKTCFLLKEKDRKFSTENRLVHPFDLRWRTIKKIHQILFDQGLLSADGVCP